MRKERYEGGADDPYLCLKIGNQAATQMVMDRTEELCRDQLHVCPACSMCGCLYFVIKLAIFSMHIPKAKVFEILNEIWEVQEKQKKEFN